LGQAEEIDQRIAELTMRLRELRRSLPAHSVKPEMLMTIEEIEEEIEDLREKRRELGQERDGSAEAQ
jgi:DNA repair exonuclease SbcCD ATPase subunit